MCVRSSADVGEWGHQLIFFDEQIGNFENFREPSK